MAESIGQWFHIAYGLCLSQFKLLRGNLEYDLLRWDCSIANVSFIKEDEDVIWKEKDCGQRDLGSRLMV